MDVSFNKAFQILRTFIFKKEIFISAVARPDDIITSTIRIQACIFSVFQLDVDPVSACFKDKSRFRYKLTDKNNFKDIDILTVYINTQFPS